MRSPIQLLVLPFALALTLSSTCPLHAQGQLPLGAASAIDTLFLPYAHAGSPGCAVGVFQNDRVTFARGYGFADLTQDVPVMPTTPFTVGSVSKQFTAASIALLVRAGRLTLDDDIRKYIPELPTYESPIRVRHLVHHTSGLRDFWELVGLAGMRFDDGYRVDDMLALAARQQGLNFPPGAEYRYSNTGYLAMGVIVQRVTGQSLRRFADSAIFAPLGMRATLFLDDHTEIVPGRAVAYSPTDNGMWKVNVWNNDLVGQGGIVTTLADLQRWDENFYRPHVGGREFVELLQSTEPLSGGTPNDYAFGLTVESYRGRRLVQHTGATGGYRAALLRFPELHTSLAMLCNVSTANTGALALRMADIVLRDALAPATTAASEVLNKPARAAAVPRPGEHAAIVGRYVSEELNGVVWEMAAGSDAAAIQLRRPRTPSAALVATDTAFQYSAGAGLVLRFDAPVRGRSPGFRLDGDRVSKIRFVRIKS